PLLRRDRPNAPSNLAFDEGLRQRDPSWGVRYLEDVRAEAERAGLSLDEVIEMPNNNLSLVFRPDRE
ncbi:MAG TPA: SAM-dependent methyltransferase, partial [Planctomycetes bacterium]|nr:SAM-dependent methyltransferase [Planctomycetota bacterium]